MTTFSPVSRLANPRWKPRAIIACRGNQTFTGCVLLATLGRAASNPPRVISGASIDEDGNLKCFFENREAVVSLITMPLQKVIDEFRRLADHLKLEDAERQEMFKELKMWVVEDLRPRKEWDHERQQHA